MFLEPYFDVVVDNTARKAFWLSRDVITTSSFKEPAMLGRTGHLVTDQFESHSIISQENLSDSDRFQLSRYTNTDTISNE